MKHPHDPLIGCWPTCPGYSAPKGPRIRDNRTAAERWADPSRNEWEWACVRDGDCWPDRHTYKHPCLLADTPCPNCRPLDQTGDRFECAHLLEEGEHARVH